MTQKNLIETILKSGISAFNKYYEMSDQDSWVYYTPEYWYTSNIASGIKKTLPQYAVLLESSVSEFRSYAGSKAGRPSKKYRTSGRADITLWKHCKTNNEWDAKSIIEIKKAWGWNKAILAPDIDRICASLLETGQKHKGGSVLNGYLVIITDAFGKNVSEAKEKIRTKIINNKSRVQKEITNYIQAKNKKLTVSAYEKFSRFYEKDNSIAAIIVFEFGIDNRKDR